MACTPLGPPLRLHHHPVKANALCCGSDALVRGASHRSQVGSHRSAGRSDGEIELQRLRPLLIPQNHGKSRSKNFKFKIQPSTWQPHT
eukprot:693885-Rhodomonas_salina.4